jgi:hypothetical protein
MSQPSSPPGGSASLATAAPSPVAGPPATATPTAPSTVIAPPAPQAKPRRDTPHQLRLLSTGVILLGLLFAVVGALTFSYLAYALHRAEADTSQLIRVQQIQTNLLAADATATNAFLVGGLEPPAQRAAYDHAISVTGTLIAEAAEAQPADADALAALNEQVVDYAATIEQARANNRQGFPVGAQYLRNASVRLRADALPILDNLVAANAERAGGEMDASIGWVFLIVGVLVLGGLVAAQVWLARRFHRTINPGLAVATALILVALIGGGIGLNALSGAVTSIKDGSFSSVTTSAKVRIEAYDAKSNESLTLIARGSGQTFEQAWNSFALRINSQLAVLPDSGGLQGSWTAYAAVHKQIRTLDDNGNWDRAVAVATGSDAASANSAFSAFDRAATSYLDAASASTARRLAGAQPGLVIGLIALFLAGLGAALASRSGVAARLKEYR